VEEEASVKGYPIKGANFLTSGDLWKSMLKYWHEIYQRKENF
jgi:hypothetical protein